MEIRLATHADLDAVCAIIHGCEQQLKKLGIDHWDAACPEQETVAADITAGRVLVGTEDNQTAATVTFSPHEEHHHHQDIVWTCDSGPGIYFNRLAVAASFQGRGYADRIMDFAEAHAERRGFRSFRLDAHVELPGVLSWYRRRGYRVRGMVSFHDGERLYAAMEKSVPDTVLEFIGPPFIPDTENRRQLDLAIGIRRNVFIYEQHVDPSIEQDGLDEELEHIIALRNREPAGCLRIHLLGSSSSVKLERIAVLSPFRGLGIGKRLVLGALDYAAGRNMDTVTMHAQYYLLDYYLNLGFEPVGEPFDEAGIRHITMEHHPQLKGS